METIANFPGAGPVDWTTHNRGVTPKFFLEEVDDRSKLDENGNPTKTERECVKIVCAGDTYSEASMPVDEVIRMRFEQQYQEWKDGREHADAGFAFDECTFINVKQARELEMNNIFHLRDLAAVPDVNLWCIQHLRELREKARIWLDEKEGRAVTDKLAEQNAAMAAELEHMRRQMAKMEAARPKRKKVGHLRKPVSAETRHKLREASFRRAAAKKESEPPASSPA